MDYMPVYCTMAYVPGNIDMTAIIRKIYKYYYPGFIYLNKSAAYNYMN